MRVKFLAFISVLFLVTSLNAKPFLIQTKLPHLTKLVAKKWDSPVLALSQAQKVKLLKIRKRTIGGAKKLNKQIVALERVVVKASRKGVEPSKLKEKVFNLAKLRAKATMLHLRCIYDTRKILTKKQLLVLRK